MDPTFELVAHWVENCVELNRSDQEGWTQLHNAVQDQDTSHIPALVQSGANLEGLNPNGDIHFISAIAATEIVLVLGRFGKRLTRPGSGRIEILDPKPAMIRKRSNPRTARLITVSHYILLADYTTYYYYSTIKVARLHLFM